MPCLTTLIIHSVSGKGRKDKGPPALLGSLRADTIWGCKDSHCPKWPRPKAGAEKTLIPQLLKLCSCEISHQCYLRKPGDRIYLGLCLFPMTAVTGLAKNTNQKHTTHQREKPSIISDYRSLPTKCTLPFSQRRRWPLLLSQTSSHGLGWWVLASFSTSRTWFTKAKWQVECGGDLLLQELLLPPTNDTATAFSGRVKRESFL